MGIITTDDAAVIKRGTCKHCSRSIVLVLVRLTDPLDYQWHHVGLYSPGPGRASLDIVSNRYCQIRDGSYKEAEPIEKPKRKRNAAARRALRRAPWA